MKNCGKMDSPGEIFQLCRLCLALNNRVNVPIFGEQGDIRQIFLKINSCLPVKIAADDLLPKNICEGCSDKLELFYAFWNSSQEAEKKLQTWVQQISINNVSESISAVAKQVANLEILALTAKVKEETEEGDDKMIIKQSFNDENVDEKVSGELSPPKKARLSPTIKEEIYIIQEPDDEYVDKAEPLTKDEFDISYFKKDEPHLSFLDFPGTSADEPQTGPSEEGKDGAPVTFNLFVKDEIEIIEEDLLEKEKEGNATVNQKPIMMCDYCNQFFLTMPGLIIHTATHTGKKDYECDLCHKIFTQTISFRDHYRHNHIGNGIFNCETCNKTFYRKFNFMRHQKIHAPHKEEFICGYCAKSFWFKHNLRTHIMREMKKRTKKVQEIKKKTKKIILKCNYCDKTCTTMYGLIIHQIIHKGEKDYKCDLCSKVYSYNQIQSFISHYRRKHYQC